MNVSTKDLAMDVRLMPSTAASLARPVSPLQPPVARDAGSPGKQDGAGFATALQSALVSVSGAQHHSGRLSREVQLENPDVSLEETMVAIQKAQIGFQATLHVRNRMVQAYTDIMNMQV